MRRMAFGWALSMVVLGGLAGCKAGGPKSPIVARVEAAGAGDLENVDSGAIQAWFSKHVDVARQILPSCQSASQNAPATWRNTTEGRVCLTAASVSWLSPSGVFSQPYQYPQRKR